MINHNPSPLTLTLMFAKLMLIIVTVGATACALLVIRQQRIDTFHEISAIHGRLLGHERTLWMLRSEIAERCRPSQVRLAVNQIGGVWSPINIESGRGSLPELRLAREQERAARAGARLTGHTSSSDF